MENKLIVFLLFLVLSACQKPNCPIPEIESKPEIIDTSSTNPSPEAVTINSWALKSNGISGLLIAVDFPTPNTGYISGTNGVVYKTSNGGESYQTISPLAGYDYYALDFVSETTGYLINNNSTADGKVYKTIDGGQNWEELTILPHIWRCIKFIDTNTGFVGGGIINNSPAETGVLFKTTDGGQNWTEVVISNLKTVRSIFIVNSNVVLISGDHAQIHKSIDGGNNWNFINQNLTTSLSPSVLISSVIHFQNPNNGFCITNGAFGAGTFYTKSTDAGETWLEFPLPPSGFSSYNYYSSIQFSDENTGYLSGGNFAENKGAILKTTDGGDTWSHMTLNTPRLQWMSLVNDTLAYTVGIDNTVLKSSK